MTAPRIGVVGGGFGGMTAAAILARAGCAVTLFEADATLGGKAQRLVRDGFRLDTGPTLLTLPHVVRDTFAACGAADLMPALRELPLQCEYRWTSGARFQAHRALEATVAAATGLEPAAGRGVRRFYAAARTIYEAAGEPYLGAPYEGALDFGRRVLRAGWRGVATGLRLGTLADLAARHFASRELRQFVGRFATYAGGSPFAASAAYAQVPWIEHAFGVHHPEGGMAALADGLGAALARLGVTVRTGTRASWITRGRGFLVGPRGGEVAVEALVVNADPLGPRPEVPLALSGYVLLLGVPRRLPLPHHTVLFSDDEGREFADLFAGRAPQDPTIYVCHPSASDAGAAPAGQSALFVMVNAPTLTAAGTSWEPAAELRARCLARLDAELPGLARDATVLGERTPVDFARQGAPRGSLYGFLPHGRLAAFRRPRMRGTPPGVFYAGGGTHPGGGVPLVMLSGRYAAHMALGHVGRAAA